jgi:hypothetical protein
VALVEVGPTADRDRLVIESTLTLHPRFARSRPSFRSGQDATTAFHHRDAPALFIAGASHTFDNVVAEHKPSFTDISRLFHFCLSGPTTDLDYSGGGFVGFAGPSSRASLLIAAPAS